MGNFTAAHLSDIEGLNNLNASEPYTDDPPWAGLLLTSDFESDYSDRERLNNLYGSEPYTDDPVLCWTLWF